MYSNNMNMHMPQATVTNGPFLPFLGGAGSAPNIQMLMQTNNDLVLAIHKAIVDSSQKMEQKIESLRDDIRDIKLNQQRNDRTLQEESQQWRGHVEALLKEQGDGHRQDTARLQEMLMKMCRIGPQPPKPPPQIQQPQQQQPPMFGAGRDGTVTAGPFLPHFPFGDPWLAAALASVPPIVSDASKVPPTPSTMPMPVPDFSRFYSRPYGAMGGFGPSFSQPPSNAEEAAQLYASASSFYKPTSKVPPTTAVPPTTTAATTAIPPPLSQQAHAQQQIQEQQQVQAVQPIVPSQQQPPITTTATVTTMPTMTAKQPDEPVDAAVVPMVKNPLPPPSQPAVVAAPAPPKQVQEPVGFTFRGNLLFGGGTGGGGSLFEGGGNSAKPGTNQVQQGPAGFTFNKKPIEDGGADASPKPPPSLLFGASPFGTAKDFKLFGGASPNANAPRSKDASYRERANEAEENEESDKGDDDDYTPDVHYEPAVPLPPEVEVLSGEEGEEVRFVARCKLFRWDRETKENKERGLGEIKVLFNPVTKKYRCVMRREKVLKLAANFPIVSDLKLQKREQMPTVYTWACKDFSEEQLSGTDETFSARFKDAAIADEFHQKMTEAIEAMQNQ